MKKVLYFSWLLVFVSVSFASKPTFPHKATLTSSKSEVYFNEEFQVAYTLSEIPRNYYYIGVKNEYFDILGKKYWEGFIDSGETRSVTFRLRLKQEFRYAAGPTPPINVGFSLKPFDQKNTPDHCKMTTVKLRDYDPALNPWKSGKKGRKIHGEHRKKGASSNQFRTWSGSIASCR